METKKKTATAAKAKAPARKKRPPKIKADPIAEYRAAIAKDGVAEVLALADDDCLVRVRQRVSTQSLELDRILGNGGLPLGRITEIYGPSHIGKSTILDHAFASVQRAGGVAILAETEGSRDIEYTRAIGVDATKLQMIELEVTSAECVIEKIIESAQWWAKHQPDTAVLIGWDSLGGTSTQEELESSVASATVASMARVMRRACRRLPMALAGTKVGVVVINHEYQMIGSYGPGKGRKASYGGEALRLAATVRIEIKGQYPDGWVTHADGTVIGRALVAKTVKNRLGSPMQEGHIAILSGSGLQNVWELYHALKRRGVIVVSGGWSSINLDGEVHNWQGWRGLEALCVKHEDLWSRLVAVYYAICCGKDANDAPV